ncbi:hypothetical protein SBA4_2420012 [Candidatus Sulfopaludibacter sp. SbA4]|nr:hypothetical protein SBA4_2420012 [Candidatus Sulfopaludibacter sp. SbA4]
MRFHQQLAHQRQVAALAGVHEALHPIVLRHHVPRPPPHHFRQPIRHRFELRHRYIAQAGHLRNLLPDSFHRRGALRDPLLVRRARQRVLHHGVGGQERDARGQLHVAVLQAAAIDLHRAVLAPEHRDVLIHDAARHADEIPLGALAQTRQLERLQLAPVQERQRPGNFQRRRRAQARAFRHRAADRQVRRLHEKTLADQLLGHSHRIVRPLVRGQLRADPGRVPFAHLVPVFGVHAQLAVRRRGNRNVTGQIQRHRHHEPQVVVGVLADQVDAPGRAEDADAFRRSIHLPEPIDHEWLRPARHAITSRKAPNTVMAAPQYRLTLASVRAARISGAMIPIPSRMTPSKAKNRPEGTLKSSILCEPDIQKNQQHYHQHGQGRRPLVPLRRRVVRHFRQSVDQPFHLAVRPRPPQHADRDGHHKAGGPRDNRDPEILRHGRRETVDVAEPTALAFGHRQTQGGHRGAGARDQPHERAVGGRALPEHAQHEGGEQRRVHHAEHELQQVHDVAVSARVIGGADREHHAHDRGEPPDLQVVCVRRAAPDMGLVDVVRPHGVERRHVSRHARHERRHQPGEPHSQHSRRVKLRHQGGQHLVVIVPAVLHRKVVAQAHFGKRQGRDAGKNHHERQEHFRQRSDQRSAPRRRHRFGRHGALHHQEIRAPVAERQDEAQARHHGEESRPHGIFAGAAHVLPGVGHHRLDARLNARPSARFHHRHQRQRREARHDQQKLKHLIVYGAGEAAQKRVGQHDGRRAQHRGRKVPSQHQLQQQPQRIHRDARREHRHHRERARVERAGLLVETHLEVFRHGAGLAAVVKRHHEEAHEQDCGNGADPVEVRRHDAVFGARGRHADEFLRAQVGRDEGQAGDPYRNAVAGEKEIAAGGDFLAKPPPDAQDKGEIKKQDEIINWSKLQGLAPVLPRSFTVAQAFLPVFLRSATGIPACVCWHDPHENRVRFQSSVPHNTNKTKVAALSTVIQKRFTESGCRRAPDPNHTNIPAAPTPIRNSHQWRGDCSRDSGSSPCRMAATRSGSRW